MAGLLIKMFQKLKSKTRLIDDYFNVFVNDFSSLGGMVFYCLMIIFMLVIRFYLLSLFLFVSLVVLFFIILTIRTIYFKPRPNKKGYKNLFERLDASSFPSVHAARIVSLLFFYIFNFNVNVMVLIFFSIVVLIVIYTRIKLRKHDIYDMIAGSFVGLISSYITYLII